MWVYSIFLLPGALARLTDDYSSGLQAARSMYPGPATRASRWPRRTASQPTSSSSGTTWASPARGFSAASTITTVSASPRGLRPWGRVSGRGVSFGFLRRLSSRSFVSLVHYNYL